ncbi:ABC transporter permease [Botrimarina sp.]|uniref:ABC transporter permease n=1 Tax=Botrimarina sp. TaxID=2795802 RepID=UPI0032EE4362
MTRRRAVTFRQRLAAWTLGLLYLAIVVAFSIASPRFFTLTNALNVLTQASVVGAAAAGLTLVMLTAGMDLSIGSTMLLASAVGGALVVWADAPVAVALGAMLAVGVLVGLVNGLLVVRAKVSPIIATIGVLFVARGCGLWITQTRALNLPDEFRQLATARLAGVATPVWTLAAVTLAGWLITSRTAFGRQLYAIGADERVAERAGVAVGRHVMAAYALSGLTAGVAGVLLLAQLATVSPGLGRGLELEAIAAAVLGGVSLFGGRGAVPGAVFGALVIQTVRNGLNLVDANPFIYPLVTGGVILLAVALDSLRRGSPARDAAGP